MPMCGDRMIATTRFGCLQSMRPWIALASFACLAASSGCVSTRLGLSDPSTVTSSLAAASAKGSPGETCDTEIDPQVSPPAELNKMSLPVYRIEPPDILLLDGIRLAPKSPYLISPQDTLQIVVANTLPEQPIANTYQVDSGGYVDLGPSYGTVRLEGLTLDEATDAVAKHLRNLLSVPEVSLTLIQPAGLQLISGEHLVAPDGTINLGIYGSAYVSGMTVDEARRTIESKLAEHFDEPSVSVEVFAYQSKVYYVITEGTSDAVASIPITGNETVLDAIATVGGLGQVSQKRIWISRPAPHGTGCDQILPVDWQAITRGANTNTNYQLMPGDRVFVAADRFALWDQFISRTTAPFERGLGFTLLGAQTFQTLQRFPGGGFF
jgi:polysaccharide biosynthesis/export protein